MFPNLRSIFAGWEEIRETIAEPTFLTHLATMDYTERDLAPFSIQPSLQSICLKVASRLESFSGVSGMPTLTTLRVAAAPRLCDLDELDEANATLREFDLEACTSVDDLAAIEPLRELRFLGLSDCGPISSFNPLESLRRLERLYAWGSTRVLDGDLSPLMHLTNLMEIRMRDRRDYRPPLAEVKAQLGLLDG